MRIKPKSEKQNKEPRSKFMGRFTGDGGIAFGALTQRLLRDYSKKNPGLPFELKPLLPESEDQRGYFEGAICPLIAYYQEGMSHRNYKDVRKVREWLKLEFNGEQVALGGKVHTVAQSTKNQLNGGFLERVMDWLIENYKPPMEALDPKKYDHWHDAIFPYGGATRYLDYLIELNILKK